MSNDHSRYLDTACDEAAIARQAGDQPAGAVLVKGDEIVARGRNRNHALNDPVATCEMDCIRQAGRRNDQQKLTLYSSRYPDMLCAGTVLQFSIGRMVIGLPAIESAAIRLLNEKGVPLEFHQHDRCEEIAG